MKRYTDTRADYHRPLVHVHQMTGRACNNHNSIKHNNCVVDFKSYLSKRKNFAHLETLNNCFQQCCQTLRSSQGLYKGVPLKISPKSNLCVQVQCNNNRKYIHREIIIIIFTSLITWREIREKSVFIGMVVMPFAFALRGSIKSLFATLLQTGTNPRRQLSVMKKDVKYCSTVVQLGTRIVC